MGKSFSVAQRFLEGDASVEMGRLFLHWFETEFREEVVGFEDLFEVWTVC